MTDVTIFGNGNMGTAIAGVLGKGGATVTHIGSDDSSATVTGDVVVLAVPHPAVAEIIAAYGDQLAGKVVVDITNPLNATYDGLVTDGGKSAAEELASLLPGSKVVKAFNTTFAGTLVAGTAGGQALDVLVAANDADAKATVLGLVSDGGLRAIDAGGLGRARELEGLALLGITLQGPLGLGFQSAWKLVA